MTSEIDKKIEKMQAAVYRIEEQTSKNGRMIVKIGYIIEGNEKMTYTNMRGDICYSILGMLRKMTNTGQSISKQNKLNKNKQLAEIRKHKNE